MCETLYVVMDTIITIDSIWTYIFIFNIQLTQMYVIYLLKIYMCMYLFIYSMLSLNNNKKRSKYIFIEIKNERQPQIPSSICITNVVK